MKRKKLKNIKTFENFTMKKEGYSPMGSDDKAQLTDIEREVVEVVEEIGTKQFSIESLDKDTAVLKFYDKGVASRYCSTLEEYGFSCELSGIAPVLVVKRK